VEYKEMMDKAKEDINHQKMAAITDLKNQVGQMSVEIAQKLVQKELSASKDQEKFILDLVDAFKPN
jgi:F-type H+-transporting ATPase subunit b